VAIFNDGGSVIFVALEKFVIQPDPGVKGRTVGS
jgi:hypothetical protein